MSFGQLVKNYQREIVLIRLIKICEEYFMELSYYFILPDK
jgi:hypothetical protein